MNNNKLLISAAGSGKTTYIVNKALELDKTQRVLITTYTIENEAEIKNIILKKSKTIPSNVTIQGWFSFLLQHGVRPFQGSMNDMLFDREIKGMLLSEGDSSIRRDSSGKPIIYNGRPLSWGEKDFERFYFTSGWKIYSDKVSKFIVECNTGTNGAIIDRLSRIYSHIFIDEVQDLAGFDLEIIWLLFKSDIVTTLVGDPRQVTYKTNHYRKYTKYKNGKIKEFVENELGKNIQCEIDEKTLKRSHRNNKQICEYSSKLYPEFEKTEPCKCEKCRRCVTIHEGVFLVKNNDVGEYMKIYKPMQLIWSKSTKVNPDYPVLTFGSSKGKTFERVIIYPTPNIKRWIKDNNFDFMEVKNEKRKQIKDVKEKFYVAITRAKRSVAIIYNYSDSEEIDGAKKWK
ncbi:MAG: UvrD-helicase domain-containing protein [Bacteroidota bacterium]